MLLQARFADEPAWFARHYEAAVARIEDHTNDEENPYYHSPAEEADAYYGPVVLNEFGGEESPEEARERAFELLVLADLAPLTPAPKAA
ncbi:MAG TPA: hypothetical protein VFT50_11520 [Baekduia sp.]|nr:hypothetical protein [Baekduia sp.]